jgi:hypothetical protein
VIDCHYRRLAADGEFLVFESTDGTRSNWDSGMRIGRLTLDILGAIPVTRLRLRS